MYILGIETSCDETAAAVVKDGREILSNVVVSQIDIFKEYGGVIPEVAARSHLEVMLPVVNKALEDAGLTWDEIDAIAVTHTPGLLGSLLIGTLTARTLAILHKKPLYAVHHLKSHIYSNWLEVQSKYSFDGGTERGSASISAETPVATGVSDAPRERRISIEFPLLALVVSGGHTQIIRMTAHNKFEIIGTTRDDAVGECFDKVAKILGLPYPGGPSISKAAQNGDPKKYKFPHPKLSSPNRGETKYSDLDFSFSGLKTAVLREVQKAVGKPISFPSHELKNLLTEQQVADFAASFENTATDILIENLEKALEKYPDTKSICLAGGVSANDLLREKTSKSLSTGVFQTMGSSPLAKSTTSTCSKNDQNLRSSENRLDVVDFVDSRRDVARLKNTCDKDLQIFTPDKTLSGDNGAMVAAAAFYEIQDGKKPTDPYTLNIYPRKPIS